MPYFYSGDGICSFSQTKQSQYKDMSGRVWVFVYHILSLSVSFVMSTKMMYLVAVPAEVENHFLQSYKCPLHLSSLFLIYWYSVQCPG